MSEPADSVRIGGRQILAPPSPGVTPRPETPTFSVVIAAYNAAAYIGAAIDSVLEQSVAPQEIIVCDDASTDETARIVEAYGSRVLLRKLDTNSGPARARNEAVGAASGEFVLVLDADDRYLPGRIEALGEVLRDRPDLDILTTDAYVEVDRQTVGLFYGPHWRFEVTDQRAEILRRNFIFVAAAVRREHVLAVGGFDGVPGTEDWALWIRLILSGSRAACIDEPLAVYLDRPDSLSADQARMVRSELSTLRKAAALSTLTASERAIVRRTIAGNEREVLRQDLRVAIEQGSPGAHRLSWQLMKHPGTGVRTRLKAAGGIVSPSLLRRRLRRRDDQTKGADTTAPH